MDRSKFFLIGYLLFTGCTVSAPLSVPPAPAGHRGNVESAEENSLEAVTSAIEKKIPYIEIDIRVTQDQVPFLFHDNHLRQNNSQAPKEWYKRKTSSLWSTEVSQLRTRQGAQVPFLEEVLSLLKSSNTKALLDLKEYSTERFTAVLSAVKKTNSFPVAILQCYSLSCLQHAKNAWPSLQVLFRAYKVSDVDEGIRENADYVEVDGSFSSRETIAPLKKAGIRVVFKALGYDTPEYWTKFANEGAEIILTDYPERFLTWSSTIVPSERGDKRYTAKCSK